MAQMFDPVRRFDEKFAEASSLLGADPDEIVSIKVRPTHVAGEFTDANAHVYPDEYAEIFEHLAGFQQVRTGYAMSGKYRLIRLESGILVLFVEHETGPEIVFVLDVIRDGAIAAGAAATAGIQIVKLINLIRDAVVGGTAKKAKGKPCQRYYAAEKISLEKRLKAGTKLLKEVSALMDRGQKLVEKIEDLDA
jgi:hypothetical protein